MAAGRGEVRRLVAVLAGDAVFDAAARQWVADDLARLRVPHRAVPVIVAAKSAAAAGLLVSERDRRIGRLTSACLVLYFALAVGAHARVRDEPRRWILAIAMLAWSIRVLVSFGSSPD